MRENDFSKSNVDEDYLPYKKLAAKGFLIDETILTKYTGEGGAVTVSEGVENVGEKSFYNNRLVTSVTLPSTLVYIGRKAFSGCKNLVSVEIPEGVTMIGEDAFWGCENLISLVIPSTVTNIWEGAFAGCKKLVSIIVKQGNAVYHSDRNCLIHTESKTLVAGCSKSVIPTDGSVEVIGVAAFRNCDAMTSLRIPTAVKRIEKNAFWSCDGLTCVTIPAGVTYVDQNAFWYCDSLSHITVEEGNPVYHSEGECLIDTAAKRVVIGCKASVIPSDGSVTEIGESAFSWYKELIDITLPQGLVKIGDWAFCGCGGLKKIVIPQGVTEIGKSAFSWCDGLASLAIPASVKSIGQEALHGCPSLKEILFDGSQTEWNDIKKGENWLDGDMLLDPTARLAEILRLTKDELIVE